MTEYDIIKLKVLSFILGEFSLYPNNEYYNDKKDSIITFCAHELESLFKAYNKEG